MRDTDTKRCIETAVTSSYTLQREVRITNRNCDQGHNCLRSDARGTLYSPSDTTDLQQGFVHHGM